MKKTKEAVLIYKYLCPACTNTAIETSNTMLGVSVNCVSCGKLIELKSKRQYVRIKS